MDWLERISGVLWADVVLYAVVAVGLLFTLWSGFGQYRALTHGVAVIRGKYDRKGAPGAVNHFQALATALSGTVGLGNIAGVAIAIAVGGPGAVFWMWVTGLLGMALKMTEVTQAMLYRNTDDPRNPQGGAMWVCRKGFARIRPSLAPLGTLVGGLFCLTLLTSAVTGGNMFQAWNVADLSFYYFGLPKVVTGIVLTVLVGLVVVGGIRRIGTVTGWIVPFMCGLYLLAAAAVLVLNLDRVPEMFRMIFRHAFTPAEATGAFLGGTAGFAFLKGMQRALFSNEAGQGSAPIAHSAARTHEPAREGVVAGLEPFVDTLCVCTLTAVVILLTGMWNREPALHLDEALRFAPGEAVSGRPTRWTAEPTRVSIGERGESGNRFHEGQEVYALVSADPNPATGNNLRRLSGMLRNRGEGSWTAEWRSLTSVKEPRAAGEGVHVDLKGATLTAKSFDRALPGLGLWIVPLTVWLFALSTIISWSYYGEQAVTFLLGTRSVMPYRIAYCLLIPLATSPIISTQHELDLFSTLGTGVMLWVNIPIMLLFGREAIKAHSEYIGRLKRGELK